MRQFRKTVTEYESELRELADFVLKLANSEEYLYSKFEEGLSLKIREKMSITGSQNYKKVVQLALREEKLVNERGAKGKFPKRIGFKFMSGQSSKKSKSSESSSNSSGSGAEFVSSPQTFRSPQPSRFGTSPPSTAFRGRATSERCPRCRQSHIGSCSSPQVCFQCG